MAENDDELYPINLLTEELQSNETEVRVKAMRRLKTVAKALGHERTRTELLPFLNESTQDEDEILVELANALGDFVPLIGGSQYATVLLEPLEALATAEETVVRDKAVEAIIKVVAVLDDATESIEPLLKRLTEGDWFTSRVSACALFTDTYQKMSNPNSKKEIRELFKKLCADDTPMVRRAAASNIGKYAKKIEKEFLMTMLMDCYKSLINDDQDSVRLLAIENSAMIACLLSETENEAHILPLVQASVEDRSWRVKYSIVKEFFTLSQAMGKRITAEHLLPAFVNLLQDPEAEVRIAASNNLSRYYDIVSKQSFVTEITPVLSLLAQDTTSNVRAVASTACMELAPKFGKDLTKEHLVPLLLLFLGDEVMDVRLNVLKKLHLLSDWMSAFESSILPAISNLARDLQWRVREAVVKALPSFAGTLGAEYFQRHLLNVYTSCFTDMIAQVREATTFILEELLESMGSDWILKYILPKLKEIYSRSTIYQERVNVIHALRNLACRKATPNLINELINLACQATRDKVPNVRFVASMCLEKISQYSDPSTISSQIRPCCVELQNDNDRDVKYYATIALNSIA